MSQYTTPTLTLDAPNGTRYAYRRFGKKSGVPASFTQHFRRNLDGWDPALIDDIAADREVIPFHANESAGSTGHRHHRTDSRRQWRQRHHRADRELLPPCRAHPRRPPAHLPGANHGFLFEFPHEFAAEVNAFLAE
ncbi:MAG: hypothetical protein ABWY23_11040 [Mycetocola sp.]